MTIIKEVAEKSHSQPVKFHKWLNVFFLLLCVIYVLAGISLVPFHGDESAYLILSEDYDLVFKKGEVEKILYDPDGKNKQYLRLSTGAILSFSIGFARDITNNEDPINKWLWGSSWEDNLALGNLPTPQLLTLARTCSALLGAFSVVVFFYLVLQLFGSRLAAWLSVLALVTQGAVLVNVRRAMQEGPKFFFLILTAYIAVYILKSLEQMQTRRSHYFLLGIASGLSLAAKQDVAPMLLAIYIALAFIPVFKKSTLQFFFINVLYLGAATVLAYATFLAFMPAFWRWWESAFALTGLALVLLQFPVLKSERIAKFLALAGLALSVVMTIISPALWTTLHTPLVSMLELRESIVGGQLNVTSDQGAVDMSSTINRLNFLLENTISSDVMYMETASFDVPSMHEQIQAYEDSPLSGRTGMLIVDGFVLVLALIGGWTLFRKAVSESVYIYILFWIPAVFLFVTIPLPWQRYFLILQIPYLLFVGVGGAQAWEWIKHLTSPALFQKETAS